MCYSLVTCRDELLTQIQHARDVPTIGSHVFQSTFITFIVYGAFS